jgi:sigma-B regulation protein RsbU (phosphoserine phosphatase)
MDTLLDTAPCYYFSFADDGKLIEVNQTLCDGLGYARDDLFGAPISQLLTLASRIFYQTHWFPLLKLQETVNELFITVLCRDKVTLPLLVNSTRKVVGGIAINECIGIVVSNRQRYEEELISAKKAYEAALSANTALADYQQQLQQQTTQLNQSIHRLQIRNDELKQVNKVVTHDLQEPVRKLLFYSEQLKELNITDPLVFKNLERLQTISHKLQAIVAGLQQYIWITELERPSVPIALNNIISKAQRAVTEKHEHTPFMLQIEPLPDISGDAEQLLAMFVHLLDNAVRFRKIEELPKMRITGIVLEQNSLQHLDNRYQYKRYLRLSLIDNGIGFEPALQSKVFELFYKTNGSTGAGLGLALCKKVVEHHQGTIIAESIPGKGTTITITLPLP